MPNWICKSCPDVSFQSCQNFQTDGSFQWKPPCPYVALTCNKLERKGRIPITWHHVQTYPQIGVRAHYQNLHIRSRSEIVTYAKSILAARAFESTNYIYANSEA